MQFADGVLQPRARRSGQLELPVAPVPSPSRTVTDSFNESLARLVWASAQPGPAARVGHETGRSDRRPVTRSDSPELEFILALRLAAARTAAAGGSTATGRPTRMPQPVGAMISKTRRP